MSKQFIKKLLLIFISFFSGGALIFFKYYQIRKYIVTPFKELIKKEEEFEKVKCNSDGIQIGYFGQSHTTNWLKDFSNLDIPDNLFLYDWKTDSCFKYREPLKALDGDKGNIITYTAVNLANRNYLPVTIIPFGVGNSSIMEWAYGDLRFLHKKVLRNIRKKNFKPKVFIWIQGTNDVAIKESSVETIIPSDFSTTLRLPTFELGIDKNVYKQALELLINETKKTYKNVHFGVALSSGGACLRDDGHQIRNAQKEIIQKRDDVFLAADLDKIKKRYDNCHLDNNEAEIVAEEVYLSIMKLNLENKKNDKFIGKF